MQALIRKMIVVNYDKKHENTYCFFEKPFIHSKRNFSSYLQKPIPTQ
jgi:hypothetical protein